jgi:N-acetylglucosamine-6-phosphate deacetylase
MRLGAAAALVDGRLVPGDVEVADGKIQAVGVAPGRRRERPGGGAGHGIAAPGFVDLQVNGFAGVDFMGADRDGYARAGEALLASGTTAYRPTFITASEEHLVAALRALPDGLPGPRILGAHLEGPFLSPRRLGVHPAAWRRDPDLALLDRLLDAGPVRQVTLAPELPGALALVDRLLERGVLASAGHTDASAEEAQRAFDRGVRSVTHLFNAMRPALPRDPGVAFAALAREDVDVGLIADGHHLAPETVLVAWRAARGRVALVTDAVAAAGMGDGDFELAGRRVESAGGAVRAADGRLAGSALTMLEAVRRVHAHGIALDEALIAATAVPARIAGRPDLGRLAPGAPADVVVLGDDLEIVRVLVAGAERGAG